MISNTAGHDYCNVRNMKSVDFDMTYQLDSYQQFSTAGRLRSILFITKRSKTSPNLTECLCPIVKHSPVKLTHTLVSGGHDPPQPQLPSAWRVHQVHLGCHPAIAAPQNPHLGEPKHGGDLAGVYSLSQNNCSVLIKVLRDHSCNIRDNHSSEDCKGTVDSEVTFSSHSILIGSPKDVDLGLHHIPHHLPVRRQFQANLPVPLPFAPGNLSSTGLNFQYSTIGPLFHLCTATGVQVNR